MPSLTKVRATSALITKIHRLSTHSDAQVYNLYVTDKSIGYQRNGGSGKLACPMEPLQWFQRCLCGLVFCPVYNWLQRLSFERVCLIYTWIDRCFKPNFVNPHHW